MLSINNSELIVIKRSVRGAFVFYFLSLIMQRINGLFFLDVLDVNVKVQL